MATSTDYTGRSVDLLIFQGVKAAGDQKLVLGFGDEGGEVVTGIQKLSQTFTTLFLTRLGTIPYHPELGTDFVTALQQGRIKDESDVKAEFAIAVEQIRQTLALQANENSLPDDETFDSAVLNSFNLDKAASKLTLSIQINSLAGSNRTIFLPIPVAIR